MQLAALSVFPVKALRGGAVPHAIVSPWGLAGDRRWMVTDREGRFITQRDHTAMALIQAVNTQDGVSLATPDGRRLDVARPDPASTGTCDVKIWDDVVRAVPAGTVADRFLTRAIGVACRLVHLADPASRKIDPAYAGPQESVNFADAFPILVTTTASLDDLNTRLAAPVPMRRFRPTLVIEGARPWEEDCWRVIRIGSVTLRIVKPCERCIVTTIDPETGARPDPLEPLRTLASFHRDRRGRIIFGQNAIPMSVGEIATGDHVEVIETGESNLA